MYLVPPGEEPHNRSTRHKSNIIKVMFLCALARPRHNEAGVCTFDSKIGLWPFVETVVLALLRASIHRPAGAHKTTPVSVS